MASTVKVMNAEPRPDFAGLTRRQQLGRVRQSAMQALDRFGIEAAELRLINHEFNTTYRVRTKAGADLALRINLNSAYDLDQVAAEASWVEALADHDDFDVPQLVRTPDGAPAVAIECDGLERARPAVLYSWLPGFDLGDRGGAPQYRQLGHAMASLHAHSSTWDPKRSASRPTMTAVLLDDPDRLRVEHPFVSAANRRYLTSVLDELDQVLAPIFSGPTQLVHGDLHGANLKWNRGRLGVFDFDDCGYYAPLQDLAIAAYYVRDEPRLEAAMFDGYQDRRPLPEHTTAQFEGLVASRNLLLLNYVLGSLTAEMADFAPSYVETTVQRLRSYEKTGRFVLD